jgi:hypothetical protein
MSRQRIEVEIQAITGEEREAAGGQEVSQGVDDPVCGVLRAGAQMEHRKNLGAGVDGQPEPEHLAGAAQPCAQFIQLHVWEMEGAERVLMQRLSMLPSASQPRRDGGLSKALRRVRQLKDPTLRPAPRAP